MAFKKLTQPKYPSRLWALVAYPGDGKSTFATQMRAPLLPIDADHRFREVVGLAEGDVYQLSDDPADSVNPEQVHRILNQNMPGGDVATIVVDSLTAIITPMVVQAVMDNDAGRNKNRVAAFKDKAMAMRLLQDAVTRWGTDVLWIYHLQDARDEKAKQITRATLSSTERARLYRSLNLELHIVKDNDDRRGIKVIWARSGRSGMIIWDDSDHWVGMPEKIEAAVYDGLSEDEKKQIESIPTAFPNPEAAIAWGYEFGAVVFDSLEHARNAYEKVKREEKPHKAPEMWALWIADVQRRVKDAGSPAVVGDEGELPF